MIKESEIIKNILNSQLTKEESEKDNNIIPKPIKNRNYNRKFYLNF